MRINKKLTLLGILSVIVFTSGCASQSYFVVNHKLSNKDNEEIAMRVNSLEGLTSYKVAKREKKSKFILSSSVKTTSINKKTNLKKVVTNKIVANKIIHKPFYKFYTRNDEVSFIGNYINGISLNKPLNDITNAEFELSSCKISKVKGGILLSFKLKIKSSIIFKTSAESNFSNVILKKGEEISDAAVFLPLNNHYKLIITWKKNLKK